MNNEDESPVLHWQGGSREIFKQKEEGAITPSTSRRQPLHVKPLTQLARARPDSRYILEGRTVSIICSSLSPSSLLSHACMPAPRWQNWREFTGGVVIVCSMLDTRGFRLLFSCSICGRAP